MIHFYSYLSRMKHIKRWGLMKNTEQENIKEHSFDVAVTAHALALIGNTYFGKAHDVHKITELALFHETSEVITGDLATPIKYYNPEIKESFGRIENIANERLLSMLPEELKESYRPLMMHEGDPDYKLVKAADKICAYVKCVEELKSGNREFAKAKTNLYKEICRYDLPEVEYYLENCLPSFELTLDELN